MRRLTVVVAPLTRVAASALWLLMTAGVAAQPAAPAGRYLIALEYRGPSVAFAEHPARCGPDRASRDLLWGTVEGNEGETGTDAVVYEGVLQRITEQTLCGADVRATTPRLPAAAAHPCRAALSGAGDVKVRIKIYRQNAEQQGAWIVLTPIDGLARVTGNCRSGEMREMELAYGERMTIEMQAPPNRLILGRYRAEPVSPSTGRWILHVLPTSMAPSS